MKKLLFFLLILGMVGCQQEEFDVTNTETEVEEPGQTFPELVVQTVTRDNAPISNAEIKVYENNEVVKTIATDANGEATISLSDIDNPDGTLFLLANHEVYSEKATRVDLDNVLDNNVVMSMSDLGSVPVSPAGGMASLMSTSSMIEVSGTLDVGSQQATGMYFVLAFEENAFNGDTTAFFIGVEPEADGSFEFLAPANTEFLFSVLGFNGCGMIPFVTYNQPDFGYGPNMYGEYVGPYDVDTTLDPVDVTSAGQGELVVTGVAENCDGSLIVGATLDVTIVNSGGFGSVNSVTTDANGAFEITVARCENVDGSVSINFTDTTGLYTEEVFYMTYDAPATSLDFGTIDGCNDYVATDNFCELTSDNGLTVYTANTFNVVAYIPGNLMLINTDNVQNGQLVFIMEWDNTAQAWNGVALQYDENGDGTLLMANTDDFEVTVTEVNNHLVHVDIHNVEMTYASGPLIGTTEVFSGYIDANH